LSINSQPGGLSLNGQTTVSGQTTVQSSTNYHAMKKLALYKTEICRSFEETGTCKYGHKCQFAHCQTELRSVKRHPRYKTEICKTYWRDGTCPYGKRCCFIHKREDDQIKNLPSIPKEESEPFLAPIVTKNNIKPEKNYQKIIIPVFKRSLAKEDLDIFTLNNPLLVTDFNVDLFPQMLYKHDLSVLGRKMENCKIFARHFGEHKFHESKNEFTEKGSFNRAPGTNLYDSMVCDSDFVLRQLFNKKL
ncbi:CCCH-type Zn-finger protein, partial [Pseudoloma neurophilia]